MPAFSAVVKKFPQKGGWTYVSVPKRMTASLKKRANWGLVPVTARVGKTSWQTSLLPKGDGTLFIALNAKVRKAESVELGKRISISFASR